MTSSFDVKNTLVALAITLLTLPAAQAASMARTDYTAEKARIGDTFKADKTRLRPDDGQCQGCLPRRSQGQARQDLIVRAVPAGDGPADRTWP
jgi:hypothetical protein